MVGLPGEGCKISAATLKGALEAGPWGGPHHVTAAVLSLTQATEAGTLYRTEEVRALTDLAHAHGLAVHMDGARFGNAVAQSNVSPADMTWRAGVDVLSFGATKGGALAAEAVVFFDPKRAEGMASRRKRGAQLVSKHRFLAAQIDAYLHDDLWLTLARHANAMADRLAEGLRAAGIKLIWPVEANLVFAAFSAALDAKLKAAGASYYVRSGHMIPPGLRKEGDLLARLVTSFATREEEVDRFVDLVGKAR
jgi:threonine aldolase